MKKIIFTFLSFIIALSTINAQKGIGYNVRYAVGGRLDMGVDSAVKNVYYGLKFPNQPNTSFNYFPDVDSVNIQVYFRKRDSVAHYRYTILTDDKPIAVNKLINKAELKEVLRPDDDFIEVVLAVFDSTSLGIFPIKDKTITVLTYDIQRPQDVYKTVFYGKPIPKAKIEVLAKRFATEIGVDYSHITRPKERIDLTFTEKDDELTIVKERTDIDYLYSTSIKDNKTDKIIFESTSWLYGGYLNEAGQHSPYVKIDRTIFKKSGDYEIIIQPLIKWSRDHNGPLKYDISPKEIETYTARYTLAITLDQENYTKKELLTYTLIAVFSLGIIFLVVLYFTRKRNKKRLMEKIALP